MFSEESKSGKNHTDVRSRAAVSDETREASQGTAENTSKDVHDGTQTSDDGDTHGTYPKVESIPEPHQAHTRSTSGPDDSFFRYGYSTRFTGPTDNKFFSEPRLFGCAGYRSQSPQMSYTPGAGGDSHGSMKPFGPGAVSQSIRPLTTGEKVMQAICCPCNTLCCCCTTCLGSGVVAGAGAFLWNKDKE